MHTHDLSSLSHSHVFDAGNPAGERGTRAVMWITLAMMAVEIAAGYWYNSMALLADGWHMSSHALDIGLSAFAYAAARRYARDPRFAFGTWKIEILGGYTSAILLLVVAVSMVWQSVERYDLTGRLVKGRNVVHVRGIDLGGIRGVVGALRVEFDDRPPLDLLTDEGWRTCTEESPVDASHPEYVEGSFTLDEGAEAQSTITANDVTVAGALEGGIQAVGDVTVTATGKFPGDVRAAQVTIEDGATFAGRLDADFDLPPELNESPKRR